MRGKGPLRVRQPVGEIPDQSHDWEGRAAKLQESRDNEGHLAGPVEMQGVASERVRTKDGLGSARALPEEGANFGAGALSPSLVTNR
ncbi:hypothetical protein NLI96_g6783 [Meripilus lineatus]|uniref:Uncharacterized protein n=1 Tax=Meripilus lineatus TaxID=2056292 RepID=A0AAD5V0Y9_9APHY|nr:hypothetical protein NLI96_g6783 [Physisporinus lineatus]